MVASAQTVVPVPQFDSIELREGGHVILRYGQEQRVTIPKGSTEYTRFSNDSDPRKLVINTYNRQCPEHYNLEIEIVTPNIGGVGVSEGGMVESQGRFPAQDQISAAVNEGGLVDFRSITATNMTAAVNEGGDIVYWGNPTVSSATNEGGDIHKAGGG